MRIRVYQQATNKASFHRFPKRLRVTDRVQVIRLYKPIYKRDPGISKHRPFEF